MKKIASTTLVLFACACSRSQSDYPDATQLRQQRARELGLELLQPSTEQISVAERAEGVVKAALQGERDLRFEGVVVATRANCATGLVHPNSNLVGHSRDMVFAVMRDKLVLDKRDPNTAAAAAKCIDASTEEMGGPMPDL